MLRLVEGLEECGKCPSLRAARRQVLVYQDCEQAGAPSPLSTRGLPCLPACLECCCGVVLLVPALPNRVLLLGRVQQNPELAMRYVWALPCSPLYFRALCGFPM